MAAVTRVIVYEDRIQAAFEHGGSIEDNVRRIGRVNFTAAKHYVPRRTGTLAASIYFRVMPTTDTVPQGLRGRDDVGLRVLLASWHQGQDADPPEERPSALDAAESVLPPGVQP